MDIIIIHYSEIGIKGGNRDFFERILVQNLERALKKFVSKVYKRQGRIIADLKKFDIAVVSDILTRIPGVANFSFGLRTELTLKDIGKKAVDLLNKKEFVSFKVETKRSNKNFEHKSPEISKEIGSIIFDALNKKVDVKTPDIILNVEVCEKEAFVFADKISGVGGLPVGSSGKMICSLSGGIDSPVSAYMMMKRGCKMIFVHIHNDTQADEGVLSKITELVEQLNKYQRESKLYIVPFGKLQRNLIAVIPSKLRMIVYRRFMNRIINKIAFKEKAKAIVTGDSVGQVASQTIENMTCIREASELPIFSPLIGMNKEEITDISKKIGTYESSIRPYPDCCSYMIAEHPETKAEIETIKKAEEHIEEAEELVMECVKNSKINKFD